MSDLSTFNMPPKGSSFEARGGFVLNQLVVEFNLTPQQAAGIVGNLGGESGLTAIQEISPISGRGGFGWAQWTGPRRVEFEKWCIDNNLDQTSDEANYRFLVEELKTTQAHSIEQLKLTTTVDAAVYTFEAIFERPADLQSGLAARIRFAQRALTGALKLPPITDPDHSAEELNRIELERIKKEQSMVSPPTTPVTPVPAVRAAPGVMIAASGTATSALATTIQYLGWWNWPLPSPTDIQAAALAGMLITAAGVIQHIWQSKRNGSGNGSV